MSALRRAFDSRTIPTSGGSSRYCTATPFRNPEAPSMTELSFFHGKQRGLQRRMGTTHIASRLEHTRRRQAFNEIDLEILGNAQFFFIATGAPKGTLDCSIKCGPPGFVRIAGASSLLFPDYD